MCVNELMAVDSSKGGGPVPPQRDTAAVFVFACVFEFVFVCLFEVVFVSNS